MRGRGCAARGRPGSYAYGSLVAASVLLAGPSAMPGQQTSTLADAVAYYHDNATSDMDPDNPMVWMSVALDLLPDPSSRAEGHRLAERAVELYRRRDGTSRPDWGRAFIDVWTAEYPLPRDPHRNYGQRATR